MAMATVKKQLERNQTKNYVVTARYNSFILALTETNEPIFHCLSKIAKQWKRSEIQIYKKLTLFTNHSNNG